jgi:antibiotic biosynthesis monooxygenase (ABM) superfamily enzyme
MTKQFNILVEIKPTAIDDFVDWQANFNTAIGRAPGLISLEFLLLAKPQNKWMIVQCFLDSESFAAWRLTSEYQSLITRLKTLVLNLDLIETEGD